jgi:hypothetical protein
MSKTATERDYYLDMCVRLRKENALLREALERIAASDWRGHEPFEQLVARTALEDLGDKT